jgi:peptidoglycan hydrolase CwlO-like protein
MSEDNRERTAKDALHIAQRALGKCVALEERIDEMDADIDQIGAEIERLSDRVDEMEDDSHE